MKVTFPPDAVMMSPNLSCCCRCGIHVPPAGTCGAVGTRKPPDAHDRHTVDYGFLLGGEISLELDDGKVVAPKPGDVVVQNGTRHAWRNPGTKPATLFFVLIGARRPNV